MGFPKLSKSSNAIKGIKAKLGMVDEREEEYDDYDEYAEDYDDYDEGYEDDDEGYDDYDVSRGRHSSSLSTPRSDIGSANLVSRQDVRTQTRYDAANREPVAAGAVNVEPLPALGAISQPTMEFRSPYESLGTAGATGATPAATAAAPRPQAAGTDFRSDGLNSLFTPSGTRERKVSVYRPLSYNETEFIAKSLKAGEVVALCFRATPDALMKRILDFAFGAASVLDAQVECVGDKTFVLAAGSALSAAEMSELQAQGIM